MKNSSPKFYAQASVSANVPTALGTPILVGDISVKAGGEGQWWGNPRSSDLPLGTPGGLGLPPRGGWLPLLPHHPCFKQAATESSSEVCPWQLMELQPPTHCTVIMETYFSLT